MQGGAPTILLVDDDEAFRYSAAKAMTDAGFVVVPVADYAGALAILDTEQPVELLVTDIIMPERIHGFALARMARMRRHAIKVMFITGYDVPTVEGLGKVLRKPIGPDELVAEVRAALAAPPETRPLR